MTVTEKDIGKRVILKDHNPPYKWYGTHARLVRIEGTEAMFNDMAGCVWGGPVDLVRAIDEEPNK